MRNYNITVNGQVYQVAVEEVATGSYVAPAAPVQPVAPVPVAVAAPVQAAAPAPTPTPAPVPAQAAGTAGATKVNAPMPGKILDIKVNVGDAVKKGAVLVILEAMKMENEIVAPNDGVIASINVIKNQTVEPGDLIATLN